MKSIILTVLTIFIYGCSPKIIVNTEKKLTPIQLYEGFVIIELKDTFDITSGQYLGEIRIKDTGLTIDCDYETVTNLAEKEARKLGGNILKITDHQLPNQVTSTCHRITGKVYKLPDISKYEKQIIWDVNRKLKQVDFKGTIENRPFTAATSSAISYKYAGRVYQGKVKFEVTTLFYCERSYFKASSRNDEVLAHEQGHFDITELYARKFMKRIIEEIKNVKDLENNVARIYNDITKELQLEQDRYDSEIYADRTKQEIWLKNIAEALKKYEQFSNKQIFIPIS